MSQRSSLLDFKITTLREIDGEKNTNLLSYRNAHDFDQYLKFQEEGHIYWIRGNERDIKSGTTVIGEFFPKFNSAKIIDKIINSNKWASDPTYRYYQKTAEAIAAEWAQNGKEASELGTILHAMIEHTLEGFDIQNDSQEYRYFQNFMRDHPEIEPYRTEWMICAEELRITGSIDAVVRYPDGTLGIIDWKRSKKIDFRAFRDNDTAYAPLNHLPNCNFSKYSLQLNLYREILERYYGVRVRDLCLVVLHPNQSNYQRIAVPRMEKEVNMILELRKQELNRMGYDVDKTYYTFPVESTPSMDCLV